MTYSDLLQLSLEEVELLFPGASGSFEDRLMVGVWGVPYAAKGNLKLGISSRGRLYMVDFYSSNVWLKTTKKWVAGDCDGYRNT